MKEISNRQSLRIYAFCLMPNHVHLLLSPSRDDLHAGMRDLFSNYAKRFNRKYERKGHLFGGRYRQAVILDDSYLLAASLYVHLNPVKAGLIKSPSKYRWSSCRLYQEEDAPRAFVDPDFILGMLAEGNKVRAQKRYGDLLRRGRKIETQDILEQEDSIDRFRSRLDSVFSKFFGRSFGKGRIEMLSGLEVVSSEELERLIQETRDSKWQSGPASREAKKYVATQLLARGYKKREIAQRLGISRKTLYNIIKSPT
jgi:putative transposase